MNILILSPHTDDIELGCGGSLTKWMEKHSVYVVAFSPCVESILKGWDKNSTKMEFIKSMESLKCEYGLWEIPVRQFNKYRDEIRETLYRYCRDMNPDLVVTSSKNDLHQDHQVISEETLRVFKCSVLGYESPYNNYSFHPVYYEKLEEKHLLKKKELINFYESQKAKGQDYFSDEFIYGLARVRGLQIKSKYAEAFECYRFVS